MRLFKMLFSVICLLSVSYVSFAQEYGFELNDKGRCVIEGEIPTIGTKEEIFEHLVYAVPSGFLDIQNIKEVKNESISFSSGMKSKSAYNPFAGHFFEGVIFHAEFKVTEGKILYKFSHFQIYYQYSGWTTNKEIKNIDVYLKEISEAKEIVEKVERKELPKKQLKEAKKIINDNEESLTAAYKVFESTLDAFKKNF